MVMCITRIVSALLLTTAPSIADTQLDIVRDGIPKSTIVLPDDASPVLTETARDMVRIVQRMSGATLPIVNESMWEPDGSTELLLDMQEEDLSLLNVAYHVRRDGDRVYFSGGDTMGVVNAVYAFLRSELGCRWYVPGAIGEYIPQRTTIAVDRLDISDEPDFESIGGLGRHPDGKAGGLWKLRHGLQGLPNQSHGHNWHSILPTDQVTEHPEWYALYNGTRGNQLCTTNPDVIDSTVAVALRYFDRTGRPMFSLSPNDNPRFCQCERCVALDKELGADTMSTQFGKITPRLVYFCNQVAERVAEVYPDRYMAFYAYNTYIQPPPTLTVHPNVVPVVVKSPWDFCAVHTLDDVKCERNRSFSTMLERWIEISNKVLVHEYYGHWRWYGPYGLVHTIRRDLPLMKELGVTSFTSETHRNWWTQGLNFYLAVRLFWDVDDDVDTMVREYYEHLYGPAAVHMQAYGTAFEEVVEVKHYDRDTHLSFIDDLTPEFFGRVSPLLDAAQSAVDRADLSQPRRDAINERLRKVQAGYRFGRAQAAVELSLGTPAAAILSGSESLMDLIGKMDADSGLHDVIELPLARAILAQAVRPGQAYRDAWYQTELSNDKRSELLDALRAGKNNEFAKGIGCVTDWHIIGPFEGAPGEGLLASAPPEHEINLDARYDGKSGRVGWTRHQTDDPFGVVDLRRIFAPQSVADCFAYMYAEVEYNGHSGSRPYARVRLGSNDGMTVWHNSRLIYTSDVERSLTIEEDRLTVTLTGGTNKFLVKVYNSGGGMSHSMRIMYWDFRPMDFPDSIRH
jgi:hypothetical protein